MVKLLGDPWLKDSKWNIPLEFISGEDLETTIFKVQLSKIQVKMCDTARKIMSSFYSSLYISLYIRICTRVFGLYFMRMKWVTWGLMTKFALLSLKHLNKMHAWLHFVCLLQLTPAVRATIITGMSEGLLFLHSKDIVHQDLKPDNIMVSQTLTVCSSVGQEN